MGVMVAPDGSLWVADSGVGGDTSVEIPNPETGEMMTVTMGDTSRIVRFSSDGTENVMATLPSFAMGMEVVGAARMVRIGVNTYVTSGIWNQDMPPEQMPLMGSIAKISRSGAISEASNTWDFENRQNPDGFIKDSHPWDLAASPDGMLYLADAGANTLLKVNPLNGRIEVVAVFDGLPGPFPNPTRGGAEESDPVPTGVVVAGDGTAYVSFLPGFPFLPGSAKVVKVHADGSVEDFAGGLTMVTDLGMGPDGNLYAVQLGLFSEQGPTPNSGALVRIHPDGQTETVLEGLSFPTGVDFNRAGDVYLTINGLGAPGSGEVHRFDGLAQ
jgi:sugar lactone lactonase YvrE